MFSFLHLLAGVALGLVALSQCATTVVDCTALPVSDNYFVNLTTAGAEEVRMTGCKLDGTRFVIFLGPDTALKIEVLDV